MKANYIYYIIFTTTNLLRTYQTLETTKTHKTFFTPFINRTRVKAKFYLVLL